MSTTPAPDDQRISAVDLDAQRAARGFGVLGFEAYRAAVLAESERAFRRCASLAADQ